MNFKAFFPIFMVLGLATQALGMAPGTVITPLHNNGQFTVSAVGNVSQPANCLIPSINDISATGSQIASSKGTPVIISFLAGQAPWWALTVGTGYLLISQCDMSNPAFISTCMAGAGYAAGNQATSFLKKAFSNAYINNATRAALATSCVGLSCSIEGSLVQDAFFAAAQAIGIDAIAELAQKLLAAKQAETTGSCKITKQKSGILNDIKTGVIQGTSQVAHDYLNTLLVSLLRAYDATSLVKILLYEQAYRLANAGYSAAYDFVSSIASEYTFIDYRTVPCTIM